MPADKKFSLLRNVLRALGLSQEASDDVVNWIVDLLAGEGQSEPDASPDFPYHLNERFLTPAELSFFQVLRTAASERASVCPKAGLGDLFQVHADDPSRFRIATNKIDRKHVDFLLCDPTTMRPLLGLELDDKSHQRADRRTRDAFVDEVFKAARLPLLHVPVRPSYRADELAAQIALYLAPMPYPATVTVPAQIKPSLPSAEEAPRCPKCGREMVLRTAHKGANAGKRFWGCSTYPTCRSMRPYADPGTGSITNITAGSV